jgi:glycosyltransferase involved in cell wall biosynthesis
MKDPLVSIIIPAYNYAHFLGNCIESVLSQTHQNLEIIVVNDGSTDNTDDVVRRYSNRISYISKQNGGLPSARNAGLDEVKGDYVLFLDADDHLPRDSIAKRVQFLEANSDVDIAVCRSKNFVNSPRADFQVRNWPLEKNDFDVHLAHFNIAPPHAFLSRKSACDAIGYFDNGLKACEDYDYWVRAIANSLSIKRSPGLVYYRRHAKSMSANNKNQWTHDLILHNRVFSRLVENSDSDASHKLATCAAFVSGACITYPRVHNVGPSKQLGQLQKNIFRTLKKLQDELLKTDRVDSLAFFYMYKFYPAILNMALDRKIKSELEKSYNLASKHVAMGNPNVHALFQAVSNSGFSIHARLSLIGTLTNKVRRSLFN